VKISHHQWLACKLHNGGHMRKVNHPQVTSGILLGLKEGYFIILQAQNIF
jgi:hypothetical protein